MSHLILFDIDGTLTLTNDVDTRCYARAMSEFLGCNIDDEWSHYRHVTDSGIAHELFGRHERCLDELPAVQQRFVSLLTASLTADPESCRQVRGANSFLQRFRAWPGVAVGLATGGWRQSALKLGQAGVDVADLAFASADDAEARTEIMLRCRDRAACLANVDSFATITYIGDGLWDAEAAAALGWRFIGIGSGVPAQRLRACGANHVFEDFCDQHSILRALGFDLTCE
jgi:phosphoglycolate phosphatase-like HAD superfamily hydrolase